MQAAKWFRMLGFDALIYLLIANSIFNCRRCCCCCCCCCFINVLVVVYTMCVAVAVATFYDVLSYTYTYVCTLTVVLIFVRHALLLLFTTQFVVVSTPSRCYFCCQLLIQLHFTLCVCVCVWAYVCRRWRWRWLWWADSFMDGILQRKIKKQKHNKVNEYIQ